MATNRGEDSQVAEAGPSGQAVSRSEPVPAPPTTTTEQRQPPKWIPIRQLNDKEQKLPRSRTLRFIVIFRVVFLLVSVGLLIVSTVAWLRGILVEVRPVWSTYSDGVLKSLIAASIAVAADCLYLSLFHGTNIGWQTAILGFASDIGAIVIGALAIVVYAGDINQFLYSSSDDTGQVNLAVLGFTATVTILRSISMAVAVWAVIVSIKRMDKHQDYLNEKAVKQWQRKQAAAGEPGQRDHPRQEDLLEHYAPPPAGPSDADAGEQISSGSKRRDKGEAKAAVSNDGIGKAERQDKGKGRAVGAEPLFTTAKSEDIPAHGSEDNVSILSEERSFNAKKKEIQSHGAANALDNDDAVSSMSDGEAGDTNKAPG